jgi:hypothetical protein
MQHLKYYEPEGMHVIMKFSVPGVHVQAAEGDVSQELQFSSAEEEVF